MRMRAHACTNVHADKLQVVSQTHSLSPFPQIANLHTNLSPPALAPSLQIKLELVRPEGSSMPMGGGGGFGGGQGLSLGAGVVGQGGGHGGSGGARQKLKPMGAPVAAGGANVMTF
jgi:hypothetical protein